MIMLWVPYIKAYPATTLLGFVSFKLFVRSLTDYPILFKSHAEREYYSSRSE